MAPQELDKVLSIKFYAEVTKRNGDGNELESLKIMQSATERYLKEKNYPLGTVHSREFHNSKEIHRRTTQVARSTRSLSLNHRRKGGLPSLIQETRIEFYE